MARTRRPDYPSRLAPRRYTPPSLLACLCLKEDLRLDYRRTEALLAWAQQLRAALGLRAVPEHATRWWFSRDTGTPRLRAPVRRTIVQRCQHATVASGCTVAGDSTGLAREPANPSDQRRVGQRLRARPWLTWAVAGWTDPLIRWAPVADRGPRSDPAEFRPLVEQTLAQLRFKRLVADGGEDSDAHHRWWREDLGLERLSPPIIGRPQRRVTLPPYRRQMPLAFPRKTDGQRWKAETVCSVVKHRWGGAITARRHWQPVKEAWRRGVTDNLPRLVHLGLLWHLFSSHVGPAL